MELDNNAAKLNNVGPQAELTWVLAQIVDHKINCINDLTPWCYAAKTTQLKRPKLNSNRPLMTVLLDCI
ncbi:transposase domain-containing protein [Pseudovibrio sp. Tun.PSC04-5.I4]|uniref:transposase domain-containing protein n=1 Tax=Pseudovibrio sp. Tun.PSC04-5.I4 TaxID=1798213 RepID=UPI003299D35C